MASAILSNSALYGDFCSPVLGLGGVCERLGSEALVPDEWFLGFSQAPGGGVLDLDFYNR